MENKDQNTPASDSDGMRGRAVGAGGSGAPLCDPTLDVATAQHPSCIRCGAAVDPAELACGSCDTYQGRPAVPPPAPLVAVRVDTDALRGLLGGETLTREAEDWRSRALAAEATLTRLDAYAESLAWAVKATLEERDAWQERREGGPCGPDGLRDSAPAEPDALLALAQQTGTAAYVTTLDAAAVVYERCARDLRALLGRAAQLTMPLALVVALLACSSAPAPSDAGPPADAATCTHPDLAPYLAPCGLACAPDCEATRCAATLAAQADSCGNAAIIIASEFDCGGCR